MPAALKEWKPAPIDEYCEDSSGYTRYRVGRFTYAVDGYDATSVTVHAADKSIFPIFVREVAIKGLKGDKYCRWEQVCESAWRMAKLQSRA